MTDNVRQFVGLFFWALIIALVALNAAAFGTVIGAISGLFTDVGNVLLVTTQGGGRVAPYRRNGAA